LSPTSATHPTNQLLASLPPDAAEAVQARLEA